MTLEQQYNQLPEEQKRKIREVAAAMEMGERMGLSPEKLDEAMRYLVDNFEEIKSQPMDVVIEFPANQARPVRGSPEGRNTF